MHNQIGTVAGKVWRHLGEHGGSAVAQIAKSLGESSDLVNMAVGWLARENKVVFTQASKTSTVALTAEERKAFDASRNGKPAAKK